MSHGSREPFEFTLPPEEALWRVRVLDDIKFAEQLIRLHEQKQQKSFFQRKEFYTQLFAVLIIVVTSVSGCFTARSEKATDLRLARADARLAQAKDALIEMQLMYARFMRGVDDRRNIARGHYALRRGFTADRINTLIDTSNALDRAWREQRERATVLVAYYYGRDTASANGWSDSKAALQRYNDCVEGEFKAHYLNGDGKEDLCERERSRAEGSFNKFQAHLIDQLRKADQSGVGL